MRVAFTGITDTADNRSNHVREAPPSTPFDLSIQLHYVDRAGNAQGPLTVQQLRPLWKDGTITASSFVCAPGAQEWNALSSQQELLDAVSCALPPPAAVTAPESSPVPESPQLLDPALQAELCNYYISVERRYSDFILLHEALAIAEEALPELPPAEHFSSNTEAFREGRRVELEHYLSGLIRHPILSQSKVLKAWLTTPNITTWAKSRKQGFLSVPAELVAPMDKLSEVPLFLCYAVESEQLKQYTVKLDQHNLEHETRMEQFREISKQIDLRVQQHDERMRAVENASSAIGARDTACQARTAREKSWLTEQKQSVQMQYFDRLDSREQHADQLQVR